jgi:hypothetical protein
MRRWPVALIVFVSLLVTGSVAGCGSQTAMTRTSSPTEYTGSLNPATEAREARKLADVLIIAETSYRAQHHRYSNDLQTLLAPANFPPRYAADKAFATRHAVVIGTNNSGFVITVYGTLAINTSSPSFRYQYSGTLATLTCVGTVSTGCQDGHWAGVPAQVTTAQ